MAAGFLTPDARLRIVTDLGVVAPGAKLNAFVAGSLTTRLATYSDVALTVPNANPVVASAGGLFGPIYLTPGVSYQLALTDSADVAIWTQDNVAVPGTLAAGTGISLATVAGVTTITATGAIVTSSGANDFRLTLTTGLPVTTADVLAATVLYATPARGTRIDLYDGSGVPTTCTSAQFSIAIPASTAQLYDVFCWNNAGVPTLELLAWTNDTTRATAIVLTTTGTWTKAGDLTRRYLGSVRTTTVAGQTEDSAVKRYLFNVSNPAPRVLTALDAADSWSYTTTAFRQANANAANQVEVVIGVAGAIVDLTLLHLSSGAAGNVYAAIGEDSVTVPATGQLQVYRAGDGNFLALQAQLTKTPAVGRHTYVWLEKGNTTAVFYGDSGATSQSGLLGTLSGG